MSFRICKTVKSFSYSFLIILLPPTAACKLEPVFSNRFLKITLRLTASDFFIPVICISSGLPFDSGVIAPRLMVAYFNPAPNSRVYWARYITRCAFSVFLERGFSSAGCLDTPEDRHARKLHKRVFAPVRDNGFEIYAKASELGVRIRLQVYFWHKLGERSDAM